MSHADDSAPASALLRLAEALEARSPGFAGRIRDLAADFGASMGADRTLAYAESLGRVVELEGAGRDAGLALVALPVAAIEGLDPTSIRDWCTGIEEIGAHSVRAAQAFGVASLEGLADRPAAARLPGCATAVAGLAERHRTDPLVPRFATAAGAAISTRGGDVIESWARYCEAAVFGSRRTGGHFDMLPAAPGLSDEELADAVDLATRASAADRIGGRKVFEAAPAALEGTPRHSRSAVVTLARSLAGDSTQLLDALEVVGPVLRRLDQPARWMVLDLANEIAGPARAAAPRFLRAVLRVGDAVGYGHDLEAFVREGLALAEIQPVAAEAFFGLETRGARAFLTRHDAAVVLEDIDTTLRGYLQLLEGGRLPVVPVEARGLFAPIATDGATVPVSERVNVFPIWEENFTLMKLQATLATLWKYEGTFDFDIRQWVETEDEGGLDEFFRRFESPEAAAGLFMHLEAARIMPRLAERYPGLAADVVELRKRVFPTDEIQPEDGPSAAMLYLALGGPVERVNLGDVKGAEVCTFARAAHEGEATVYDTARCTTLFSRMLSEGELVKVYGLEEFLAEDPALAYLLDLEDDDTAAAPGDAGDPTEIVQEPRDGKGQRSDETSPSVPLDPELLKAYLEQNPDLTVQRSEGAIDPTGLFVAGLTGSGMDGDKADRSGESADRMFAVQRPTREAKGVHLHDEWDHRIEDYRVGWCHVHDVEVDGDSGSFFTAALSEHRELLPEVRRQFQRVKPEGYRVLRGLLDGEDFDLNAVVTARADLRARHDTSSKLYTARKREERDVATLFLLDMSASTDEETEPPPPAEPTDEDDFDFAIHPPQPKRRRIIDIQKEALVIMSQALEEIGDLYAIYGFSGHGRRQVELFSVKSFDESLTMGVRSRIGGIEPQRSTRMGAALRQALTYFRPIVARSKHLILLSDGFPQDFDYGDDRRSNVYGLKDTAMALREAQKSGISTFCITVDRAGNDYLREMCEEKRYLVIDEIGALPLELPKIYSEATRGG
ncbi:MAG: hypothetical protein P8R42_26150 [Candidatus Binatia bacterium]|nr:hypothetical protein [Candidatus Binatia bacterium]